MDRPYDLVFSLGAACSCSQALRLAGLQFASFPFDWLYGGSLTARVDGLLDGLDGWFDPARLAKHAIPWTFEHEAYRNAATGIVYKHDFDWNRPLAETVGPVREKYARRLKRLEDRLAQSSRALAVWLATPTTEPPADDEICTCRARLAARWPAAGIELLVLACERGRPQAERRVRDVAPGVRVVSFDYFDGRDEFVDNEKMAAFLKGALAATDYRTPAERRAWPAKRRALRYAQYGATNAWSYFVNRAHVRLYRHLKRWLAHKGLDRLG